MSLSIDQIAQIAAFALLGTSALCQSMVSWTLIKRVRLAEKRHRQVTAHLDALADVILQTLTLVQELRISGESPVRESEPTDQQGGGSRIS